MESLKLSFEAVMPIFILMLLGYVLKNLKIADKNGFDSINKLVFKVFLPVLLFYNIYKTDSMQIFDTRLILFVICGVFCVFGAGYFAVKKLTSDNRKRGVMLQDFFRSNFAILGIPLVDYICGDNSTGLASLMVAIVIPLFNVLAVISLERFRDGSISAQKLLKGIITNPLIIGCALGAVFFVAGIKLPSLLEKSVSDISKIATPLSIVVLGASFTFSSLRGYARDVMIIVSAKLVIVPLIMLTAAVFAGFRGEAFACLLIVFGAPVAVSSFAMSQQMGGDETLAAQAVVISSALCLLTLFVWIFALNFLGLF